jgi:hypothetical protein
MGHWKANGCCGVDSSRSYFICLLPVDTARVDTLALAHAKKYKVSASEIFHVFAAWADEVDTARDSAKRRPSRGERRPWLLRETRRGERRGDRGFLNESRRAWDDAAKSAKRIHLKVIMAGVENTTKSVRTLSAKLLMHDTDTILVLVLKSGNIHDTKETCARTVSYA